MWAMNAFHLPINCNRHVCVGASTEGVRRHEHNEPTLGESERLVAIKQVHRVERRVEYRY